MKKYPFIIGALSLVIFASCSKKLDIDTLAFGVSTASNTYKVGDVVSFKFVGNPDFIGVFSGEDGHDYAFRERTTIDGKPQLEFTSYAQFGTQTNSLQLMVSNNFSGTLNAASVNQATWKNITDRATLSTGANNTPSGVIDLTDFLAQKKPVYIAFKYTGQTGSTQKTWTINNLVFNLLKPNNTTIPITDLATGGWSQVDVQNPAAKWSFNATQLKIAGGGVNAGDNEDWIISKLLYLNSVLPDVAIPVKNISQKLESFDYVFKQPGTYKVVFLVTNATADAQGSTTREIVLTIK